MAAKHGVVGLMKTLANELGPRGVRVNTVHPTECDTDMLHHPTLYRLFRPGLEGDISREQFAEATTTLHMLLMPWVDARDVSNMIAFLASDEGRFGGHRTAAATVAPGVSRQRQRHSELVYANAA